jgi:hypothetical protein
MSHTLRRQLAERYAGGDGLIEVRVARFAVHPVVHGEPNDTRVVVAAKAPEPGETKT